jgi:glutamate racemase
MNAPTILVFDSGLGGLTVHAHVARARPDARIVYAADDAVFPYGRLTNHELEDRVVAVFERLIPLVRPDLIVIACNTASTIALSALRSRFTTPFVGTVPAVKPAAAASKSRRFSVLGTPGTVRQEYTAELIRSFASDCNVTLVGAPRLAALAEAEMRGEPASDRELAAEIEACFVEDEGGRTDVVALACTHYPLVLPRLERLAPWPVTWIDPAPAIARRVVQLIGEMPDGAQQRSDGRALFTSGRALLPSLKRVLSDRGLSDVAIEPMPAGLTAAAPSDM